MAYPYRLLAPGPVPVPPLVMKKMSEKVIHHRTPEFEKILVETWAGLRQVFHTSGSVEILCGTGSLAMEAAVVNLLSPGDEALVVVSGKFGERWVEICKRYGIVAHTLDVEWGSAASLDGLETALKAHPKVKAVFSQVCETSTATVHPIREMAKLIRENSQALFAVDAITAVGCMPIPMDAIGIDCMIAGSQKAFMIPTGLSFIALNERAWKAQAQSKTPKFYLDLALEKKANAKNETHFSTPTPLIVGLHEVLKRMQEVGMDSVITRCQALASVTRKYGARLGLETFSKSPSSSVTALKTPGDSGALRDWLEKERNITVMGGQDHLKGKIVRIGHMGDVRDEDMMALFEALCEKLGGDFASMKQDLAADLGSVGPLFK